MTNNEKDNLTFEEAINSLSLKFQSGNTIDVERTTVTRKEWDAIWPVIGEVYLNTPKTEIKNE